MPRGADTKLARVRRARGVQQEELAVVTGIPLATLRRLEQSPDNPKLRHYVNCALALGVELQDVLEDHWLEWTEFTPGRGAPPRDGWFERRRR